MPILALGGRGRIGGGGLGRLPPGRVERQQRLPASGGSVKYKFMLTIDTLWKIYYIYILGLCLIMEDIIMINKKISLYPDTSIFGGYYDDVFMQDTRLLFEKIKDGTYDIFVSSLTQTELKNAPDDVKKLLNQIEWQPLTVTQDCELLADEYIKENVVGATSRDDCIHIATATIHNIDILVSWNFKHIVNIERIRGYNSVNMKHGYKRLDIHSPKEMGLYE
jgi:predicted nucleic acid-binding protein